MTQELPRSLLQLSTISLWPIRIALLIVIGCVHSAEAQLNAQSPLDVSVHTRLQQQKHLLSTLHINNLSLPSQDESNRFLHNPLAIEFGKILFFDNMFSRNQKISCASCHQPKLFFTDGRKHSRGIRATLRNAPTLLGIGFSSWFFWDGRRDSLWSQAITPFEHPNEHGITRIQVLKIIENNALYLSTYQTLFGDFPELNSAIDLATPLGDSLLQKNWRVLTTTHQKKINHAFANIGKAIAAYVSTLNPKPAKFDRYIDAINHQDLSEANQIYSEKEALGLEIFLSEKGQCLRCHNGPLLTNHDFHNIGSSESSSDYGRLQGIGHALIDPFNCFGDYSDADMRLCAELRYAKTGGESLMGAFKVPTLRNVAETGPYMHNGRFKTLQTVLDHYNEAPISLIGHQELNILNLTKMDIESLIAFLKTLTEEER